MSIDPITEAIEDYRSKFRHWQESAASGPNSPAMAEAKKEADASAHILAQLVMNAHDGR